MSNQETQLKMYRVFLQGFCSATVEIAAYCEEDACEMVREMANDTREPQLFFHDLEIDWKNDSAVEFFPCPNCKDQCDLVRIDMGIDDDIYICKECKRYFLLKDLPEVAETP
jgi:hypothetical protein